MEEQDRFELIEDKVMDYIEGSTIQPSKEDAPAHAKYMKGEIRPKGFSENPLL